MKCKINLGPWGDIFPVPAAVVDKQLKLCSGLELKVLLCILRSPDKTLDMPMLAQHLCVTEQAVREAADYWINAGFLTMGDAVLQQPAEPATPAPSAAPEPTAQPAAPALVRTQHNAQTGQTITTALHGRVKLTAGEIAQMAVQDLNIPLLLEEAQAMLGKTLSPNETDTLLYLYSYLRLSPQYLFMLISYCAEQGKGNMRYIEKTAAAWVDKNITTPEQAEAHIQALKQLHQYENLVRTAFGLHGRELSAKERAYIEVWGAELGIGAEMLKLAYDRTVDNTGKLAFAYIDKILHHWHQKNITTPKAAMEEMAAGKASKAAATRKETSYDINILNDLLTQKGSNN